MDFYKIAEKVATSGENKGMTVVSPSWIVGKSKDLMIRGKGFYAIWNEHTGLWDTDEYSVPKLVDQTLFDHVDEHDLGTQFTIVKRLTDFTSNSWKDFKNYTSLLPDNYVQLDERITFANTNVTKEDYVSRRLPYSLDEGNREAYEEIMTTLYDPSEREKLEWAIGAIISGDSKKLQKFIVLYGDPGTGKSTFLNIMQKLFDGYYAIFDAAALTSRGSSFSTAAFAANPMVAVQHDVDLSRIEDNTLLNSIASHEEIIINEKYKAGYPMQLNAFLFVGTNKPVKITDAKSGIIRRLIDVHPSGRLLSPDKYHVLVNRVDFELGAIAKHCLDVYRKLGKDHYSGYRPEEMILQTDVFYNYIEYYYDEFRANDHTTLVKAYDMYSRWCDMSAIEHKLPRHKFREELRNYFDHFHDRMDVDGERKRSVYTGFKHEKFGVKAPPPKAYSLALDESVSLLDSMLEDCPAQYANDSGIPTKKWADVDTKLSDIDTTKVHFLKVPSNHIVIDFDLRGPDGEKSPELNIEAASQWPPTYAEYSKSGAGIHLHYLYDGDTSELSRIFSEGIEIKVFVGDSSLRRKVSRCNNITVSTLSGGLPLKEKRMINKEVVQSERGLRNLIEKNLRKEVHPATKPSIDFIHKILEDAYASGIPYSVIDLRPKVLTFAANSTNQSAYCVKLVASMKFQSEGADPAPPDSPYSDPDRLVFFDIESFPNLFHISWKYAGDTVKVHMTNPEPEDVMKLVDLALVGFNNRAYDNHMLYAAIQGYSVLELWKLSQRLIKNDQSARFPEAYNLSYTDVYDFASAGNKKSLKRFQVELGLTHKEMGLDWNEPVPQELWPQVIEYCDNDVDSLESVFYHLSADFEARKILAELSGLTVNHTTNNHSVAIMFGKNKTPQGEFVYTDLSEMFPGYKYESGISTYRGVVTGEGGYVYSEPGMYTNVGVLDVQSMHPTSIEQLDLFGPYTEKFSNIKKARVLIKHGRVDEASELLHLDITEGTNLDGLSDALKTVINSVYGLTSAKFDNPFRDIRNKDNIVAKRGALFMLDLKFALEEQGVKVIHIKTDSVKIPDLTPDIVKFVENFGARYGYIFEHEKTYDRLCLVNDAVFIGKIGWAEKERLIGKWEAVGAQFQEPFVYKTLFSKEPIEFQDLCVTRSVTTALYLDYGATKPMYSDEARSGPQFVGRVGQFTPVLEDQGGGVLLREKDGKFHAANDAKNHFWMESEVVKELGKEDAVDYSYFEKKVDAAMDQLKKYGDVEWFIEG